MLPLVKTVACDDEPARRVSAGWLSISLWKQKWTYWSALKFTQSVYASKYLNHFFTAKFWRSRKNSGLKVKIAVWGPLTMAQRASIAFRATFFGSTGAKASRQTLPDLQDASKSYDMHSIEDVIGFGDCPTIPGKTNLIFSYTSSSEFVDWRERQRYNVVLTNNGSFVFISQRIEGAWDQLKLKLFLRNYQVLVSSDFENREGISEANVFSWLSMFRDSFSLQNELTKN